jgi:hypothetical protein
MSQNKYGKLNIGFNFAQLDAPSHFLDDTGTEVKFDQAYIIFKLLPSINSASTGILRP